MTRCQTEDDCTQPMWCRGKSKCAKVAAAASTPEPAAPSGALAVSGYDRETLGRVIYDAYRASINRTTDYPMPDWSGADHETQLAFRDAGEIYAPALTALREASSLLAFMHGAFADRLKPEDKARLERAHVANRRALSLPNAEMSDAPKKEKC